MKTILNTVRSRSVAVYAFLLAGIVALFAPSAAYAQSPAPSGGVNSVVTDQFSQLTNTLTTTLIPALFALGIIGLVAGLGWKYLRKGAARAGSAQ